MEEMEKRVKEVCSPDKVAENQRRGSQGAWP